MIADYHIFDGSSLPLTTLHIIKKLHLKDLYLYCIAKKIKINCCKKYDKKLGHEFQ